MGDNIIDALEMPGIYRIICIANNKQYIGSSINVYKRLMDHHRDLKRGMHAHIGMRPDAKKYGVHYYSFEVLEYIKDKAKRDAKEIELIRNIPKRKRYNKVVK